MNNNYNSKNNSDKSFNNDDDDNNNNNTKSLILVNDVFSRNFFQTEGPIYERLFCATVFLRKETLNLV